MNRCKWCNLNNPKYIDYHDNEWGVLNLDDTYLLEMLILEMFQAGLSWECVLNKREAFRRAYDDFDIDKICNYTEDKIKELVQEMQQILVDDGAALIHGYYKGNICSTKAVEGANVYTADYYWISTAIKPAE